MDVENAASRAEVQDYNITLGSRNSRSKIYHCEQSIVGGVKIGADLRRGVAVHRALVAPN